MRHCGVSNWRNLKVLKKCPSNPSFKLVSNKQEINIDLAKLNFN